MRLKCDSDYLIFGEILENLDHFLPLNFVDRGELGATHARLVSGAGEELHIAEVFAALGKNYFSFECTFYIYLFIFLIIIIYLLIYLFIY